MNVLFMRCRSKKNPERSGFFFIFSKNLDSGACQVKNLKREKLSDFLGLTAARPDKIAQTAGD